MPKYKEIKIDLNLSPEMILGETIKKVLIINANEQMNNQTKVEDTNQSNEAE